MLSFSWAIGDFEYVEDFTKRKYNGKPLPVRVYTTRGLKEQGRYALEHAHQIIDYFSEIFDIDYPLPKSDLLAVHEFVSTILKSGVPSCVNAFPFYSHDSGFLITPAVSWCNGKLGSSNIPYHCCLV
jgi:hypothetical protein